MKYLLLLFIIGCSNVQIKKDSKVFYERDLKICVNGKCKEGAVVIPRALEYKFEFINPSKNDYLILKTCNRHQKFVGANRKIKYKFIPIAGLEDKPNCPIEIESLDKHKSKNNAWGFAVIDNPDKFSVPARLLCNGQNSRTGLGTTICQSRTGLIQKIQFDNEMFVASCQSKAKTCPKIKQNDIHGNKTFTFRTPKHNCCYMFLERAAGKNGKHLLYTIGYDQSNIR